MHSDGMHGENMHSDLLHRLALEAPASANAGRYLDAAACRVIQRTQLFDSASRWQRLLQGCGCMPGTAVILPMRIEPQSCAMLLGALAAGLFPILVRPGTPALQLDAIARKANGALLVARTASQEALALLGYRQLVTIDATCAVLICPLAPMPVPDAIRQPSLGILSSGSTGAPKIIVHPLANVLQNARMHIASIGLESDDTVGLALPLHFSYGLVAGGFGTLLSGADAVFIDPRRVNAERILAGSAVSVFMGTPGGLLATLGDPVLAVLRILTVGGDVLHAQAASRLLNGMPRGTLYATYGLTEAGPRVATARVDADGLRHFGAVPLGRPLPGVELSLASSADGAEHGELVIASPTLMTGYLGEEALTTSALTPDGRLRTGDLFRVQDGEHLFVGRAKRLIVRHGENICPVHVERTILRVLQVEDVWVTAEQDSLAGQVPKAFVQASAPVDVAQAVRSLRAVLPASHIPAAWEQVKQLPAGARK